jgi:hypothetical protein
LRIAASGKIVKSPARRRNTMNNSAIYWLAETTRPSCTPRAMTPLAVFTRSLGERLDARTRCILRHALFSRIDIEIDQAQ